MQKNESMQDLVSEEVDVPVEQEAWSGELYDVLCQFCTGEALGIVRATTDMQGFAAWQKLHRKYQTSENIIATPTKTSVDTSH